MTDAWTSPLAEIEHAVQERAKLVSLDLADEGGSDQLLALIDSEVVGWSEAHKRGLRPFDLATPELVVERVYRNLAGYGPLEPLLEDDDVWEVMVNAPDATLQEPDVSERSSTWVFSHCERPIGVAYRPRKVVPRRPSVCAPTDRSE